VEIIKRFFASSGESYNDQYQKIGFPLKLATFRCALQFQTHLRWQQQQQTSSSGNNQQQLQQAQHVSSSAAGTTAANTIDFGVIQQVSCVKHGCELLRKAPQNYDWSERDKDEIWDGIATFFGMATIDNVQSTVQDERRGLGAAMKKKNDRDGDGSWGATTSGVTSVSTSASQEQEKGAASLSTLLLRQKTERKRK